MLHSILLLDLLSHVVVLLNLRREMKLYIERLKSSYIHAIYWNFSVIAIVVHSFKDLLPLVFPVNEVQIVLSRRVELDWI